MSETIKGINVKIGSDTTGLSAALKDVNSNARNIGSELRKVERLLKFNPENTELLAQKQKLLGNQVGNTREKLDKLKDAQSEVNEQFKKGEISEGQYRAFQREIVKTESQLKHYESQINSTTSASERFAKKMKVVGDRMKSAGDKMKTAGAGLTKSVTAPILGVGAALFGVAQKTANAGDAIQKMAKRTGLSTEALSEYKHAAELSGTSLESLEKGVKRMQSTIYDAEKGLSTATDALEDLGVTSEELAGKSPEQQFEILSSALADVDDASRKAALAQDIFGRAGTEMLPMLAEGSEGIAKMRQEARDLGIVFDQEAADSAAKFNDDMDRLKKSFTGVFQELGQKLIPIFVNDLIPVIKETLVPMIQDFADKIAGLIDWFANLSPTMQKTIGALVALATAAGPVLVVVGNIISAIGTIMPIITTIATFVGSTLIPAIAAISAPVLLAVGAITAAVAIWALFGDEIKAFLKGAWEGFKLAISNFVKWLPEKLSSIKDSFLDKFNKIKEFLSKFSLYNIGKNIIQGLIDGIKKMLGKPVQMIKDMAGNITKGIKGILGINSPSKVFAGIGENMAEGLMEGLSATERKLQMQVHTMVNGMIPQQATAGATGGQITRTNNITINQHISDKATADYATNKLGQVIRGRGVGGGFL